MSKSPAFQWYAADYLADERVMLLSLAAEGAYTRLLSFCWREGSIPSNPAQLSAMCKHADVKIIKEVVPLFSKQGAPPGRLIHKRLEEERDKQEAFKSKQADNGRLGGRPRKANPNPTESQNKGLGFSGETQTKPKKRSSTSSSTSSSFSKEPLPTVEGAGEPQAEIEPWLAPLPESSSDEDAPGGATDVGTALIPARGGKWDYNPAEIHPGLVLPFENDEFREAWTTYRRYREEKGLPRLNGGLQEQEALRNLSNLADGDQEKAHNIIAQAIRKGWKDLYKLDEQRSNPQQNAIGQPGGGAKPTGAAVGIAAALVARRFEQQRNGNGATGQTAGAHPGQSAGVGAGVGPH